MLAPTEVLLASVSEADPRCAQMTYFKLLAPEVAAVLRLHYDHATKSAKTPTKYKERSLKSSTYKN